MPGPNHERGGWAWVAIAFCALAGALAMPAVASAATEPLELAKAGSESEKIVLGPLPDPEGTYTGHLTVLVVNRAKTAQALAIDYIQDTGSRSNPLAAEPTGAVSVNGSPTQITLSPGSLTPVQLTFQLAKGQTASSLAGELLLSSTPLSGDEPDGSLVLPVSAEFEALKELTINPAAETIQVTRGWPSPTTHRIELTGPGAAALLDRKPPFSAHALLGNGDGHHVRATLDEIKEAGGAVQGTLTLSDDASPGEYTGVIPLGAGAGAPELHLTVKSHLFILWFVLLVLVGSLLGGLLPKLTQTRRRRSLMRLTLRNAIKSYERERAAPGFIERVPWDLKRRMGKEPWLGLRWNAIPGSDGYAGLYAQLRWARSEGELDDLGEKVTAAVNDVSFWISLRECGTRLHELREGNARARNGTAWKSTNVAQDTDYLIQKLASDPPKTLEDCNIREGDCIEQVSWHKQVLDAWVTITKAQEDEALTPQQRADLTALDFAPIADGMAERDRKIEDTVDLASKLATLASQARGIDPTLPPLLVESRGGNSVVVADEEDIAFAVKAKLEKGKRPDIEGESTEHTLRAVLFTDLAVTSIVAIGSVVFYVTPLWTSTWGTLTDVLTAAAAGFGTQIVVQWGALPLLQPLFNKPSAPPDPSATAPAAPAPPAPPVSNPG